MLPTRYVPGQPSAIRKSRLDARPSMLPKPRRPGSTDPASEARRPSGTGPRSSSAEPQRATIGVGRLSREASATKIPLNRRSRSQQGESRLAFSTPLRNTHYSRPTVTPIGTPSEERLARSWITSLERALAFVTVKDQRMISDVSWQRATNARVQEALASRGEDGMALVRPLTIARFVDVCQKLLTTLNGECHLNNDNYISKLPHICKRLLYPGAVSKSWLRTVNTLHAFPQALALIAYLLDIINRIEIPVSDELVYIEKDEITRLRRDYIKKCWDRFQEPQYPVEDLNEEYLSDLKILLGIDDEKIEEMQKIIQRHEESFNNATELAIRAEESEELERYNYLTAAIKGLREERRLRRIEIKTQLAEKKEKEDALEALKTEIEKATLENQQLRKEVSEQTMSVAERNKLCDELDYTNRVLDSKRVLAQQLTKMVLSKETELAMWQKKALDSCVEYRQGLVHLSAQLPDLHGALAALAIDEQQLMSAECVSAGAQALELLRAEGVRLHERRAELMREKSAAARRRALLAEETRAKIAETKLMIEREQRALEADEASESEEAAAWAREELAMRERIAAIEAHHEDYERIQGELRYWEEQHTAWQTKLSELQAYLIKMREEVPRKLEAAKERRAKLIEAHLKLWNEKLNE